MIFYGCLVVFLLTFHRLLGGYGARLFGVPLFAPQHRCCVKGVVHDETPFFRGSGLILKVGDP